MVDKQILHMGNWVGGGQPNTTYGQLGGRWTTKYHIWAIGWTVDNQIPHIGNWVCGGQPNTTYRQLGVAIGWVVDN